MSRWLQSAKLAEEDDKPAMAQNLEEPISSMGQRDNWDRTDKTPKAEQNSADAIAESSVSSVVSVFVPCPKRESGTHAQRQGRSRSKPIRTDYRRATTHMDRESG